MPTVLIVGASRGLGLELVKQYAEHGTTVYATSRSHKSHHASERVHWVPNIDIGTEQAGPKLVDACKPAGSLDTVIITAGYFGTESFDDPKWDEEVKMYTISAIGPVFVVHHLYKAGLLPEGAKIIFVSSESGSITLRHEVEGGGNFAHHGSKAALNMIGRLLSLDLKDKGVAVGIVHPGFMRTEMTKGVGFDKYWDDGGAVTPAEAATSLIDFVQKFNMGMTGQYWAPRGPKDIGTAKHVLGEGLSTPLQLPW